MSYPNYAYLMSLINEQESKLEKEYRSACSYIPQEVACGTKPSGRDKAYEIFLKHSFNLREIREELKNTVSFSYQDHPNPKMREFWGCSGGQESATPIF